MSQDPIVPVGNAPTFIFTIDRSMPVRLSVTNNDGEVNVKGVDGDTITVVATLIRSHSGDHSGEPADDFVVDEHDNHISVRPNWQVGNTVSDIAHKVKTQLKEGFRAEDWDFKKMRFAGDASYDLEVSVPRDLPSGSTVALKTTSGDVRVTGLVATTSVATASGDARVEQVEGKVSAHSASGDVTLRQLTGSVESNTASGDITFEGGDAWTALRSVSGDINVREVTLKNARITTVSGTVTVDATVNNAAEYSFDSVSGDMRLTTRVPASGASLTYRSMSGDTSVDGDWTKGSGKRSWTIRGNEGGPKLSVKTVSGDLRAHGVISGDVEARTETMPQDVKDHEPGEDQETMASTGAAASEGQDDSPNITIDADWEKAKGWLKDITSRVSKFVNDLDAAGNERYEQRKRESESPTEPITVEPLEAEAASALTEPVTPPTPPAPTEPIPPTPPTPPVTPEEPEPAQETTAQRRLRLLEAVQRGELTVDEALAQLDGPSGA